MQRELVIIAHNVRSAHNVGSLLRTADGLGVVKVCLTGYTPYPQRDSDARLPHEALRVAKRILKTSLGAENFIPWEHYDEVQQAISELHKNNFAVIALEQTPDAISLSDYTVPDRLALIVGREVEGIEPAVLVQTDARVVIPMFGQKESFNVAQAAAMALYHCRFAP